jgi:hypothetical protein
VNFGDAEATVDVAPLPDGTRRTDVLFATPSGAGLQGATLTLPPHAGAVLR